MSVALETHSPVHLTRTTQRGRRITTAQSVGTFPLPGPSVVVASAALGGRPTVRKKLTSSGHTTPNSDKLSMLSLELIRHRFLSDPFHGQTATSPSTGPECTWPAGQRPTTVWRKGIANLFPPSNMLVRADSLRVSSRSTVLLTDINMDHFPQVFPHGGPDSYTRGNRQASPPRPQSRFDRRGTEPEVSDGPQYLATLPASRRRWTDSWLPRPEEAPHNAPTALDKSRVLAQTPSSHLGSQAHLLVLVPRAYASQ